MNLKTKTNKHIRQRQSNKVKQMYKDRGREGCSYIFNLREQSDKKEMEFRVENRQGEQTK